MKLWHWLALGGAGYLAYKTLGKSGGSADLSGLAAQYNAKVSSCPLAQKVLLVADPSSSGVVVSLGTGRSYSMSLEAARQQLQAGLSKTCDELLGAQAQGRLA